MSQENVETVRRLFRHWEQGDWRGGRDLFDERCEAVFSASWFPDAGEYRVGPDAMRAWIAFTDAFETVETRLDRVVDAGDRVVLVARTRGRGRASGADVDALTGAIFTLRDGKIVRYVLTDARDALEAVGLRE
jgi:ketosteroid isomerase-like protein